MTEMTKSIVEWQQATCNPVSSCTPISLRSKKTMPCLLFNDYNPEENPKFKFKYLKPIILYYP